MMLHNTMCSHGNTKIKLLLLLDGKDGNGLKAEKIGPTFSSFSALSAKNDLKIVMVSALYCYG